MLDEIVARMNAEPRHMVKAPMGFCVTEAQVRWAIGQPAALIVAPKILHGYVRKLGFTGEIATPQYLLKHPEVECEAVALLACHVSGRQAFRLHTLVSKAKRASLRRLGGAHCGVDVVPLHPLGIFL